MRFAVTEDHLMVISDLHLGNPNSTARARVTGFLDHVLETGASLCINGDGFDLAQTSFPRLAGDSIPIMGRLRRLTEQGLRVYYVVGNHDMVLEHFLSDLVFTELAPFLNVRCGDSLIRVEHGHLYDPWYARSPRTYTAATRIAGYALVMVPDVYRLYSRAERGIRELRNVQARRRGISDFDALSPYRLAAETLIERGFDTVVFGHTHDAEQVEVGGGLYINSGNWLRGDTYVELRDGTAELKHWNDGA
jgi:UDP-2,3-diacylglucosamine pyrophosphatase LpxH